MRKKFLLSFGVLLLTFLIAETICLAQEAPHVDKSGVALQFQNLNRATIARDSIILVELRNSFRAKQLNSLFIKLNAKLFGSFGTGDLAVYEVLAPAGKVDKTLWQIKSNNNVKRAYKNIRFKLAEGPTESGVLKRSNAEESSAAPNDPDYKKQYHLHTVKAQEAWADGATGNKVTIAIFDSGCDGTNLVPHMYQGYDAVLNRRNQGSTDVHGHGTCVATTVAAQMGDSKGGVGVARLAYILPIRVANSNGFADLAAIQRGFAYCNSWSPPDGWGGPLKVANLSIDDLARNGPDDTHVALHERFKYFHDHLGGLVVVAAGNDKHEISPKIQPYLIVVSANEGGNPGRLAEFSNWGKCIKFNAPGTGIVCSNKGNHTTTQKGTSFSSPIVAAMAAMLWTNKLRSNVKVEELLRRMTIRPNGRLNRGTEWDSKFGFGMPVYRREDQIPPENDHPDDGPDRPRPVEERKYNSEK